ncbi:MAG: heterodisulfide reductase subunit B [Nitrospiraceae bacterium]|nr:heterodisulfide reductase subunit B [Nitrospiraceae bacterium]
MKSKMALYPGCSLEGSASGFWESLEGVLGALDVPCETLRDWSCCGATSAHALDKDLHLALNLRNLTLVQEQGYEEVMAPCAACYHRLASAAHELNGDAVLRDRINQAAGLQYGGEVVVRNVLDFLFNDVGVERIAKRVTAPLAGLKAACYYGCLNTRVPRMDCFDDREYPMSMDHIVGALGVEALDWSYKTDCCGASLFLTAESASSRLVSKILRDAEAQGADCIVVACPMCHNNLDTKQAEIRAEHGIGRAIPIVFVTQLMGLAYGLGERELKLAHSFVPFQFAGK